MISELEDSFYDCRSDAEEGADVEAPVTTVDIEAPVAKDIDVDMDIGELIPNVRDSWEIRQTLERVANSAHLLLRSVGGQCEMCANMLDRSASCSHFYPATLEISARLHTDTSCTCPPHCQCVLRGDPVTLNLPMELNPYSGQVKVDIFQPK
ncbi:hypothetical protein KR222_000481, partial [Zaprionus bogoriensis]